MGNAQRLPNGNTFICWADAEDPKGMEVNSAGVKLWQMNFANSELSYRSFRFNWNGRAKKPYILAEPDREKVSLIMNKFGDSTVTKYYIFGGQNPSPETIIDSSSSSSLFLSNLPNIAIFFLRVKSVSSDGSFSEFSNEVRVFVNHYPAGANMVVNGDFSQGVSYWFLDTSGLGKANGSISSEGEYFINITHGGTNISDVRLFQSGFAMVKGKSYIFEFDARATAVRTFEPKFHKSSSPYINYSRIGTVQLPVLKKHFSFTFSMTDNTDYDARLLFDCGAANEGIFLDNISLREKTVNAIDKMDNYITPNFKVLECFPNPSQTYTTMSVSLPAPGEIKINIYDILGREIKTQSNIYQSKGQLQIKIDLDSFSSGVYFYLAEFTSPENSNQKLFQKGKFVVLR